ncbi:MAG: hypothetical protein KKD44_26245 [Proteobacteria bacterium]|nr:hypothetical protein [Pseudomonadota bacterium]
MTVTVSGKNFVQISGCESMSDGGAWTFNKGEPDGTILKQGTYALVGILAASSYNSAYVTKASGYWDLSGMKHLRMWFLTTVGGLLETDVNGGVQLSVSDGTNTGYYYVAGKTTYSGGWINLVADLSRSVDDGTKPPDMSLITRVGFRTRLTGISKNALNTWADNLCVCDGLLAYGDDAGGYFDFDDVFSIEDAPSTGGWGVMRKIAGVYFLTGSLEFGYATSATKFQALSQVVVFENRKVNDALYGISVVDSGNASYTTEFILGDKSGTAGVQGCTIRVQNTTQTPKFYVDGATDTDVDNFKLYGSTFLDASTITFPPRNLVSEVEYVEILNCSFESCGAIIADTAIIKNCNFVSPNEVGILISSESHNVTYCTFVGCIHGVEFDTIGTYGFNHMTFIGGDGITYYDVENSSTGLVTINASYSNPTYIDNTGSGATTNVINSVTVMAYVKDRTGDAIVGARVHLEADVGGDLPSGESVSITRIDTTATVSHTAHGMSTGNTIIIRGANQVEYNGAHIITKIDDSSYSYTVSGTPDTPATGTITATAQIMSELTIAGGIATESHAYTNIQPVIGYVRKSSSAPYYKHTPISGTINTGVGVTINATMADD